MLQVKVESEAGPFGEMPKRFRLDGREVEIAENIDRWCGVGYCYFKVKGDDGNLYILRFDEQTGWELTMFQSPQAQALATQSHPPRDYGFSFMTGPFASHRARYWHELDDGRIQCDLCPRFCRLHEGQRAFCFLRARHGGELVLTTYGRSSGFCVDPVEKKALNHFLPGTPVLSFGTSGCNLGCKFCQNWDISKAQEFDVLAEKASPEDIARTAERLGCPSVAYTYNDPTIFHEYAVDTAIACHDRGIKSIAVTSGYMCPEPRAEFFRHMDAANIDLKGFTEDFYHRVCYAHLQPVLDTLVYVKHETRVWLEITTLLIPGLNDSEKELEQMTEWVVENLGRDVPWHFTAFHPDWRMKDIPPTPVRTLSRARDTAMKNGVRYAFTGNVHDPAGQATYCRHCRALLIGREGYEITDWQLIEGKCRHCGMLCAGVFQRLPGTWGSKRRPVSIDTSGEASAKC